MKFYEVGESGKIIFFKDDEAPEGIKCLKEIIPGTTDAAAEKHVPVIEQDGDKVTVRVGSVDHPMLDVHYIQWIVIETASGVQKRDLNPEEAPVAEFVLTEGDELIAAYEYCNLHKLWMAKAE